MSRKADKVKREAQEVESRLRAAGWHMDAETVARLRKGYAAARATAKVLHRDNMDLRNRLGLPSFHEANGIPTEGEA